MGGSDVSGLSIGDVAFLGAAAYSPVGQAEFITPGIHSWEVPAGVTTVCVVGIAGGGGAALRGYQKTSGGGGGALGYRNNISVTPGQNWTIYVGAAGLISSNPSIPPTDGENTTFGNPYGTLLNVGGGKAGNYRVFASDTTSFSGGAGGTIITADAGGRGGAGGAISSNISYNGNTGGGGAGGYGTSTYSQNGGAGGVLYTFSSYYVAGYAGQDGAAGGGGSNMDTGDWNYKRFAMGGGGTGIYGKGANGAGGNTATTPGYGGSGGGNGIYPYNVGMNSASSGGLFGGGAGSGCAAEVLNGSRVGYGGGALRIIWGTGRAFPDTLTQNM